MNQGHLKVEENGIYDGILTETPQETSQSADQPQRSRVCSFKAGTPEQLEVIYTTNQQSNLSMMQKAFPQRCKYRHISRDQAVMAILAAFQDYKNSFKQFEKIFLPSPSSDQEDLESHEIQNREPSETNNIRHTSIKTASTQPLLDIQFHPNKEAQFKNFVVKIFTNFLFRGKQQLKTIQQTVSKTVQSNHSIKGKASWMNQSACTEGSPDHESGGISGSRANQQQSQYHNLKNSFMHLIIQVFTTDVLSCLDLDDTLIKQMIAVIERMKKHSFKYRPVKGRYQYYSNIHYSTLFLELNSAAILFEIQTCQQSKQFHDIFFESDISAATTVKDEAVMKCNFFKQLIGSVVTRSIQIAEQFLLNNLDPETTNSNRYTYISKVTKGIQKLQRGKHVIRF